MVSRVEFSERRNNIRLNRRRIRPVRSMNPPAVQTIEAAMPKVGYIDYSLIFTIIVLCAFGLLMLFSTSSYNASLTMGDPTYYFRHQLIATALGAVVMIVAALIPYGFWKKLYVPAYAVSVISLLLVLTPLGMEKNGARRWIKVGGTSIQPAEIVKIGLIIFLAALVCKLGRNLAIMKGKLIFLGVTLPVAGMLYLITDNLSSALIVFGIALVMLFVATPDYKNFVLIGALFAAVAAVIVYLIMNVESVAEAGFRFHRIQVWLNPEAYEKGFQTVQGLYAIGSGGILGKGLGQSMQKLGFVPEAQNDMIFSIICEELGLFGAFLVMVLFMVLIWRLFVIANNAPDRFGAMITVGVMAHIMIQVILNIAVVTNTIPNTGITLPFISYGGTSILFLMAEMGLVMSVARRINA